MQVKRFLSSGVYCLLRASSLFGPRRRASGAQSFQQMQRPEGLSPAEISTLERLHELSALPDGPWRVHEGDLAHGEVSHGATTAAGRR